MEFARVEVWFPKKIGFFAHAASLPFFGHQTRFALYFIVFFIILQYYLE
jgi:hypothetical protein